MASYAETVDFLFGLRNRGSKYGLERMVRFAAAAGNPERSFPVVHVAGTNGKGSVCAMVEAALRGAGFKTGLYTSPHLVHPGERVQVDRLPLSEGAIVEQAAELRRIAAGIAAEGDPEYPSFFEFMTLMAFRVFAEAGVDCAVVEVGLGGRLDATNIVRPAATAITSIGLDHCDILGDTLAEIAAEKAGILKEGVPVVVGKLPTEALRVVRARSDALGCPRVEAAERFDPAALPETNLVGAYQRWNAGVALLLLEAVRDRLPVSAQDARKALRQVYWPGRWDERVLGGRRFIVDCTHNPEGAAELAGNLRERAGPPSGALEVIVGSLGKDRARAVLAAVAPFARRLHLVRPDQPRALSFAEMRALVPREFRGAVVEAAVETLFPGGDALNLPPGADPVVLTGSLYLVGEVYARIGWGDRGEMGALQDRP